MKFTEIVDELQNEGFNDNVNPAEFYSQHGKCPNGWKYDENKHQCVKSGILGIGKKKVNLSPYNHPSVRSATDGQVAKQRAAEIQKRQQEDD